MKKIAFVLALIVSRADAQTYYSFPVDSATWSEVTYWYSATDPSQILHCNGSEHFGMYGDTVIAGVSYSKLYRTTAFSAQAFVIDSSVFFCGIREDSAKRVYYRLANDTVEWPLYDFDLNVGESFFFHTPGGANHYLVVISIDSTLMNDGTHRRTWHFNSLEMDWIEGVGGRTGLFEPEYPGTFVYDPVCFSSYGVPIYGYDTCYCSSLTSVNAVQNSSTTLFYNRNLRQITLHTLESCSLRVYDAVGRLILDVHATSGTSDFYLSNVTPGFFIAQVSVVSIRPFKFIVH